MPFWILDADLSITGRFWVEADTQAEAQTALEAMTLEDLKNKTDDRFARVLVSISVTSGTQQLLEIGAPRDRD